MHSKIKDKIKKNFLINLTDKYFKYHIFISKENLKKY